jgi:hypothetical protein
VRTFDTVEDRRQALLVFQEVYSTSWLIDRHGFQTPAAVRQDPAFTHGTGRVAFKPVFHQPRAVQREAAEDHDVD